MDICLCVYVCVDICLCMRVCGHLSVCVCVEVSAAIHSYRCNLLFIIFVPNLKVNQLEYAIARDG